MDELTSLHRLYLACEAERDSVAQELDVALADLTACEVRRRRLAEQLDLLVEQNQALQAQVAQLQDH
jgi:hypothetical protein